MEEAIKKNENENTNEDKKDNNNEITNSTSIRKKIFIEQVHILHRNLILSVPANFLCASVIFVGLYQILNSRLIWCWFIAVGFISIFRLIAFYFYNLNPQKTSLHLFFFILSMSVSAALWGFAGSFLMPVDDLLQQMIIIVIIAGVTAGGIQTLNGSLIASLIYVSLTIFPLCTWMFLQSEFTYMVLGIAMTCYLLFMLVTSIRSCKLLKTALTLHYENLVLVEDLSDSNKKLSQSYKTLEQHEQEMALLNKMNDMLQTCQVMDETYEIIVFTAKELFVNFDGGLAICHSKERPLEIIKHWGNDEILKSHFTPDDCWALRQGNIYSAHEDTKDLICHHLLSPPKAYICLPIIIQNEVIGVLTLYTFKKNILSDYELQLAVSFCEVIQLTLANIKLRESLYDQAVHDPLTGLFNRRYMDRSLTRCLQRSLRDNKYLCVAMLDLDHFKIFNDTHGHEAGDELLKLIGNLLRENFRESDIACRFGGEEFLIVLPHTDISAAHTRLKNISDAVNKAEIHFQGKSLPSATVSIGIAEAPTHGRTKEDIIQAADQALYAAKQAGRNRIEMYSNVDVD